MTPSWTMEVAFGHTVTDLVRRRRHLWHDVDVFCLGTGIPFDVVQRVERSGVDASLRDLGIYAAALDVEVTIRQDYLSETSTPSAVHHDCVTCGAADVLHPQQHSARLGVCVDSGMFELLENLWALQIITVSSCQGERDGDAHIVFRDVDDLRALLRIVEDDRHLRDRAGLGFEPGRRRWGGGMNWQSASDGIAMRAVLRLPHDDLAPLVELTGRHHLTN